MALFKTVFLSLSHVLAHLENKNIVHWGNLWWTEQASGAKRSLVTVVITMTRVLWSKGHSGQGLKSTLFLTMDSDPKQTEAGGELTLGGRKCHWAGFLFLWLLLVSFLFPFCYMS